jgi:hypothetical protein
MWIIYKQVGVFTHYLTPAGIFQPGIERASRFSSQQMAEIIAKKHGGAVRQVSQE